MTENIDKHKRQLIDLQTNKVNIVDDEKHRKEIAKRMKKIDKSHDTLMNQQDALESYVEKYLPLKLQHQMSETLIDCLDKKTRVKFIETNTIMSEALREDIIKDTGHPKLKLKALDLISKLRVESKILNPQKTARATGNIDVLPQLNDCKNFDDTDKEKLGLDENGQIKVNHGEKEIKEMIEQGMIKIKRKTEPGVTAEDMSHQAKIEETRRQLLARQQTGSDHRQTQPL